MVAGLAYADSVAVLAGVTILWRVEEGRVAEREPLGTIRGSLFGVLRAERPLLNLLQRASGIASLTRAGVRVVGPF